MWHIPLRLLSRSAAGGGAGRGKELDKEGEVACGSESRLATKGSVAAWPGSVAAWPWYLTTKVFELMVCVAREEGSAGAVSGLVKGGRGVGELTNEGEDGMRLLETIKQRLGEELVVGSSEYKSVEALRPCRSERPRGMEPWRSASRSRWRW